MPGAFDEMTLTDGSSRPGYELLKTWVDSTPRDLLSLRCAEAELLFRRIGIACAALSAGHGVCQDLAHIFIAAARRVDEVSEQDTGHACAAALIEDLGWGRLRPGQRHQPDRCSYPRRHRARLPGRGSRAWNTLWWNRRTPGG